MDRIDRLYESVLASLSKRPAAERVLLGATAALLLAALVCTAAGIASGVSPSSLQPKLRRELASSATRAAYRAGTVPSGEALVRIRIPKLGVDTVAVQGVDPVSLRAGAGHYPSSAFPCSEGDSAIAGHRTTYGGPFAQVDRLVPGDEILVNTPVSSCRYVVEIHPFTVLPTDVAVLAATPGAYTLTLTAGQPKGSDTYRIIVKAQMVSSSSPSGSSS